MANQLENLLRLNRTPAMPRGSNRLAGVVEPAMTAGSNILAEIPAYAAGMAELNKTGLPSEGVRRAEEVSERLTYNPRTMEGQAGLQSLTNGVMKVMDALGVDEAVNYLNNTVVPRIQETFGEDAAREIGSSVMMAIPFVRKVPSIKAFHGSPHDFPPVDMIVNKETGKTYYVETDRFGSYKNHPVVQNSPDNHEFIEHFPQGHFDNSKMGTGEGAQAYGHGAYVAGNEDVAIGYRNNLSEERTEFFDPSLKDDYEIGRDVNNKWKLYDKESGFLDTDMPTFRNEAEAAEFLESGKLIGDAGFSRTRNKIQKQLEQNGFESSVAEDAADRVALGMLEGSSQSDRLNTRNFYKNNNDILDEYDEDGIAVIDDETRRAIVQAFDLVNPIKIEKQKGYMYEVGIDATPDEFLDYDIPLTEQSELVRNVLKDYGYKTTPEQVSEYDNSLLKALYGPEEGLSVPLPKEPRNPKGSVIYRDIQGVENMPPFDSSSRFDGASEASAALAKKGIKGIRYKDGFSRNKDGGSHNYVIFDDRLISIAKKYGIAIPAAAALLSQETGLNPSSFYEEDNPV